MNRVSIPTPLLNQIANYLTTRPYKEVAGFIKNIESQATAYEEKSEDLGKKKGKIDGKPHAS